MISEFVDRQAANADLYELEDVLTGEKRQYRIVSKATVTVPGTDLNKATFDPILSGLQSIGGFEKMAVLIDDWNAVTENGIYMANGGANAPVSGEWHMGILGPARLCICQYKKVVRAAPDERIVGCVGGSGRNRLCRGRTRGFGRIGVYRILG